MSATTNIVNTRADAAPTLLRPSEIAAWILADVVSLRVLIMVSSYGLRQTKPSRSSIARPDGGPHVPAAYPSGWFSLAAQ